MDCLKVTTPGCIVNGDLRDIMKWREKKYFLIDVMEWLKLIHRVVVHLVVNQSCHAKKVVD